MPHAPNLRPLIPKDEGITGFSEKELQVDVWIPRRPDRPLTYTWPRKLGVPPTVGLRVVVPLRKKHYSGYVTVVHTKVPETAGVKLRPVEWVIDTGSLFSSELINLLRWAADYYIQPLGAFLHAALPPGLHALDQVKVRITNQGKQWASRLMAHTTEPFPHWVRILFYLAEVRQAPLGRIQRVLGIKHPGAAVQHLKARGLVETREKIVETSRVKKIKVIHLIRPPLDDDRLTKNQRLLLEFIASFQRDIILDEIQEHETYTPDRLARLARRGFITIFEQYEARPLYWDEEKKGETLVLTPEQQRVVSDLAEAVKKPEFVISLLHGVTASGKTEVYMELADIALDHGRTVLILLPEIGLIPSVMQRFTRRFGENLAVLHSGLTGVQRLTEWQRVRGGSARVILGTRSAVFAPIQNLGLIVVDEEQDGSYKQDVMPIYNARDVAMVRARLNSCPLMLVSATPSVETYARSKGGQYRIATLSRRVVPGARLPEVQVVDMRESLRNTGDPFFSPQFLEGLEASIEAGESAIILLNRRGYAPMLLCRACGASVSCPNCSIHLVLHRSPTRLICHYCGYESQVPQACPECKESKYLSTRGLGTQRVLQLLAQRFPGITLARLDSDLMRKPVDLFEVLARFQRGDLRILIGTQMIAKAHHFPLVTFVGVLEADAAAGIPDFRSGERLFQLLTQVVGRAGRAERAGRAVIQSYRPEYYPLRYACNQDYEGFFKEEIGYRNRYQLPPFTSLTVITVQDTDRERAKGIAFDLHTRLTQNLPDKTSLHGPLVPLLWKLRNRYRYHILARTRDRQRFRRHVQEILDRFPLSRKFVKVDIDPDQII